MKLAHLKTLFAGIALLFLAAAADAQSLKIATGSPKGTYATMFRELNNLCANTIPMVEQITSGSNENVNLLIGNQVNAAITQTDVLYFRARTEDLGNVKTLLTLHPEEVHFVAKVDSGLKTGGTMGIGAKPVVFNDITNLGGYAVGAAGGSATTAKVIRLQSEIPFNVQEYPDNDKLAAALKAGQVQAAVFVGGAPYGFVSALGGEFKLLPVPAPIQEKLKGVYRPARLTYTELHAAGVPTVATEAILVTREYKTAKMTNALAAFRACAVDKLDELRETTGTHPKWQAVDASNHGKWAWYDLPDVVQTKHR